MFVAAGIGAHSLIQMMSIAGEAVMEPARPPFGLPRVVTGFLVWAALSMSQVFIGTAVALIALGAAVGARTTWALRAASLVLWTGSLPLGVLWLRVTAPDFADALHAIKTGAAIPWLVVALGLPFLARAR